MILINIYLLSINIISFIITAYDKLLAIKNKNRISEHTLITLTIFGGSLGTLLSMIIFKHKTRKPKFYILVPLFLIIHIFIYNKIPLN